MVEGARLFGEHRRAGVRRSAQPHRHRRREVLFRAQQPSLRPDRLRAVESLGQRRGEPVHAGVLRPGQAAAQSRRPVRAVDPRLRVQRPAACDDPAGARRRVPRLRGLCRERRRPHRRRLGRCASLRPQRATSPRGRKFHRCSNASACGPSTSCTFAALQASGRSRACCRCSATASIRTTTRSSTRPRRWPDSSETRPTASCAPPRPPFP